MGKIEESKFVRLVGTWKTTGEVKSEQGILKLTGMDSYELILEGHFILHKADVMIGDDKSETFEIIGLENLSDKAKMQYFNTKGEEGIMWGSILNNEFNIAGNELKFIGTFNNENTRISGKWFMQAEKDEWIDFIELTLEKENSNV